LRPFETAAFDLLLPTPKPGDQKTPGMPLQQGTDRNHA